MKSRRIVNPLMEQKLITRQGTWHRERASAMIYAWDEILCALVICEWDASSRISTLISPALAFSVLVKTFPSPSMAALQASAGLMLPELALSFSGCRCRRIEFMTPVLSLEI